MIDAELYTISIRKELIESDVYYVARVTELPDIEDYGETYEEAKDLVIDSIETSYELCFENGISFPEPYDFASINDVSGRITLRMPKSLHKKMSLEAEKDNVSLNSYIVSSLSINYGEQKTSDLFMNEIRGHFSGIGQGIQQIAGLAGEIFSYNPETIIKTIQPQHKWTARIEA
jgi:predicted HicB family RNase H-like nuclease